MANSRQRKPALERILENWLFRSRWLLAPIYFGLVAGLAILLGAFGWEMVHTFKELGTIEPKHLIVAILAMIDLSLAANLVLLVIFSGYEQFIARIDTGGDDHRLKWMGEIDFSNLKLKLVASLVAISAVALLQAFMEVSDREAPPDEAALRWMVGIHLTFVVSGLLLALMDYLVAKTPKSE